MKTEELLPGQDPGQWSANITQTGSVKIVLTWDGDLVGELSIEDSKPKFKGDHALSTKAFHQLIHALKP